jgi:hypothetical protein
MIVTKLARTWGDQAKIFVDDSKLQLKFVQTGVPLGQEKKELERQQRTGPRSRNPALVAETNLLSTGILKS